MTQFAAEWQTEKTTRWAWTVTGDAPSFAAYEVTWADTLAEVESDIGVATVGSVERSELGAFDARGGKTSGPVSLWTTTFHDPKPAEVFAKITVRDIQGNSSSMVASTRLLSPTAPYATFFDGSSQVVSRPASFEYVVQAGRPSRYVYKTACSSGVSACKQHVELSGGTTPWSLPGSTFTAAAFDRAFLHVKLAGYAMVSPGYDSAIGIRPAGCMGDDVQCEWRFTGFTYGVEYPPAVQVPLRELMNPAGKLTYARLQEGIDAVSMSGTWTNGSRLEVTEVRIRW